MTDGTLNRKADVDSKVEDIKGKSAGKALRKPAKEKNIAQRLAEAIKIWELHGFERRMLDKVTGENGEASSKTGGAALQQQLLDAVFAGRKDEAEQLFKEIRAKDEETPRPLIWDILPEPQRSELQQRFKEVFSKKSGQNVRKETRTIPLGPGLEPAVATKWIDPVAEEQSAVLRELTAAVHAASQASSSGGATTQSASSQPASSQSQTASSQSEPDPVTLYRHHGLYELIVPFMTPENLSELAKHTRGLQLLKSIARKLDHKERFAFWEDVLSAVGFLPDAWRAKLFLEFWMWRDNLDGALMEHDCTSFHIRDYTKEELAASVASSSWLVDDPIVRDCYCRLHRPGYEELNCINSTRVVKYPGRETMLEHIKEDDVPQFMIAKAMYGLEVTPKMMHDIVDNHAVEIFKCLLDLDELFSVVTPEQLLFYTMSHVKSEEAMEFLESVEEKRPGTVARAKDALGNNLLWYSIHNPYHIIWFSERSQVTKRLAELGCSFTEKNHLGLSPQLLAEQMTAAKKRSILRIARKFMPRWEYDELMAEVDEKNTVSAEE